MKTQPTTWLAATLLVVAILFTACAVALAILSSGQVDDSIVFEAAINLSLVVSLSVAGLLLAAHRPGNPVGWLFLVAGISVPVIVSADLYVMYITETSSGALPDIQPLYWVAAWAWIPAFLFPATFGVLLFPTGRLPSRRWRPIAWMIAIGYALMIVAEMFGTGPLLDPPEKYPQITNPLAIEPLEGLFDAIITLSELTLVLPVAVSVASIFARLKTATGTERQQIKWFAYSALIPALGMTVFVLLLALPSVESSTANLVAGWTVGFGVMVLPITVCIAILRHNLYDIDKLISRTLVYGLMTALLLATFTGGVLLFQFVLSPVTGGNDLAIAVSTLLTLVLFQPVRSRLQDFVDRRFYRRKYDTQRTLERFGIAAREAVDLDQLTAEMMRVVSGTMQPEHLSLWLRNDQAGPDRTWTENARSS